MSRIEQGQLPGYHELEAMLDLYQLTASEWTPIIELWERAQHKPDSTGLRRRWSCYHRDDLGFPGLEADASMVREFQLGYVPGLLQVEEYSRHIFHAERHDRSEAWIDAEVATRLRRQHRLMADEPLKFHCVIDETILRRAVPPEIMQTQLRRLANAARLANVIVQIVSRNVGMYEGLGGNFVLLSYPDPAEPDIAYAEHPFGALRIENAEDVRDCRRAFDHVVGCALDPDDSVVLVEQIAAELKS